MINLGAVSYGAGAALFLLFTLLLLTAWRGRLQGALMVGASAGSLAWCALLAFHSVRPILGVALVPMAEVVRDALWLLFLLGVLGYPVRERGEGGGRLGALRLGVIVVSAALLGFFGLSPYVPESLMGGPVRVQTSILGFLGLSIIGMGLIEQIYRNTLPEHRWAIKFLCLGVGALFAYDFFLYSTALLFRQVDPDIWVARGAVNALVVPFIAVAVARNPQWSLEIFVSRHIVFHTAAVLGAGLYLVCMAAAGYYIRLYGGTWGGVAQTLFLFGAGVLLVLLMFSGQLRSRAKVFLGKHFFRNRYDYREEWLRFTQTLSLSEHGTEMRHNIIRAIASIVESPGGVLWVRHGEAGYEAIAHWHSALPAGAGEPCDSSFVRFLAGQEWVIFLDEYERDPEHYEGLRLPRWLESLDQPWVVAPLMHGDELLGFIVLSRSPTKSSLNWEDSDLLKTVGRQAASHLALLETTEALTESRQFEAFNRLSSYVVHDLKNLVAQLSLLGANAKTHGRNPQFISDAFATVDNATSKMNRLLAQLKKDRLEETSTELVNLRPVLDKVVALRAVSQPAPVLELAGPGLIVRSDPDRLASVIEHLVQNAQEASAPGGTVTVRARLESDKVLIEICDTGCGMDAAFIRERLFKPFDTTKGNAGMGIGVYEAREFIVARGGSLDVESAPGAGTTFRIGLPCELECADAQTLSDAMEMRG